MAAVNLVLQGEMLVPGSGAGLVLASDEPISLWGGLDPATGEIIDRRHPLSGQCVSGRILSIPFGRGSCSAAGVLLESIAAGTGPAGIIVSRPDPILGLGAILGDELLLKPVPMVLLSEDQRQTLRQGTHITIDLTGRIVVSESQNLTP